MAPAEFAPLADFYAEDMARCREALAVRLGYDCGERSVKRVAVTAGLNHNYYGRVNGQGRILTIGNAEFMQYLMDNLPYMRGVMERDGCWDWHENTHAAIGALPLPVVLNEGLAVFMSPHGEIVCNESGFTVDGHGPFDFTDLTTVEGATCWRDQFTAICAWKVLEGEGITISDALNIIATHRDSFSLFVDALERPDLRDTMQARFGFYDYVMQCDGDGWKETAIR